jgi:hypothetical protein
MHYTFIAQIDEGPSLSAYMQTDCLSNRFIAHRQARVGISAHWVRLVDWTPLFSVSQSSLTAKHLNFLEV